MIGNGNTSKEWGREFAQGVLAGLGGNLPSMPHTLPVKHHGMHVPGHLGSLSADNNPYLHGTKDTAAKKQPLQPIPANSDKEKSSAVVASAHPAGAVFPGRRVVFVLGGPGSGKGTQCARLVAEFGWTHLSAGDLLRAEVARGTELGRELDRMMREGVIVPLDTTMRLLREAMLAADSSTPGFLIDGFPREIDQAVAFEDQV